MEIKQWLRDRARDVIALAFPSVAKLSREVEQLRVQLAGCAVAAHGGLSEKVIAHPGMYGWSPAYQDVVDLRRKYDDAREALSDLVCATGKDSRDAPAFVRAQALVEGIPGDTARALGTSTARVALAQRLKALVTLDENARFIALAEICNELNRCEMPEPGRCPTCGQRTAFFAKPRVVKR